MNDPTDGDQGRNAEANKAMTSFEKIKVVIGATSFFVAASSAVFSFWQAQAARNQVDLAEQQVGYAEDQVALAQDAVQVARSSAAAAERQARTSEETLGTIQEQVRVARQQLEAYQQEIESRRQNAGFQALALESGHVRVEAHNIGAEFVPVRIEMQPIVVTSASLSPRAGEVVVAEFEQVSSEDGSVSYIIEDYISQICRWQELQDECSKRTVRGADLLLVFDSFQMEIPIEGRVEFKG